MELSKQLGMAVFAVSIAAALILYFIDRYERINLSLPMGLTIPYVLVAFGGGMLLFSGEGLYGFMKSIASAIFVGLILEKAVPRLRSEN